MRWCLKWTARRSWWSQSIASLDKQKQKNQKSKIKNQKSKNVFFVVSHLMIWAVDGFEPIIININIIHYTTFNGIASVLFPIHVTLSFVFTFYNFQFSVCPCRQYPP